MSSMSNHIFFKAKFSVTAQETDVDLLWQIVFGVKAWLTKKCSKNGCTIDDSNETWSKNIKVHGGQIQSTVDEGQKTEYHVFLKSAYFQSPETGFENWACAIYESPSATQGYCQRQWTTEIGFEQTAIDTAVVSCVISYRDVPFLAKIEAAPSASVPGFLLRFMHNSKIKCHIGMDTLSEKPIRLDNGDYLGFWKKLLCEKREAPYIYVSPKAIENSATTLVNSEQLAKAVFANAFVFYSDSPDIGEEMDFFCEPQYKCYDGAVRVYLPHINVKDSNDSFRHRFLSASQIEEIGSENAILIFRRMFAQNTNFYDTFFKVEDCKELRSSFERKLRLAQLEKDHKTELNEAENVLLNEASRQEEQLLKAEEEIDRLASLLKDKEETINSLNYQISSLQDDRRRVAELESALAFRKEMATYPNTPNQIAQFFCVAFKDSIAFSDDAIKSLKYCTLSPDELWKVLFALATEWRHLILSGDSNPYKTFQNKTGWDIARGEGKATRNDRKLMRQYITSFEGRQIDIEPHITWPREGQSIHFGYDEKTRKIVVGHCGEHLDNYSTRKAK